MKLFVVLTIAGKIAGTWGPISQPIEVCESVLVKHNAELSEINRTNNVDYHMSCEFHPKRPTLDLQYRGDAHGSDS